MLLFFVLSDYKLNLLSLKVLLGQNKQPDVGLNDLEKNKILTDIGIAI